MNDGPYSTELRHDHGDDSLHHMIDHTDDATGDHTLIGEACDAEKAHFLVTAANAYGAARSYPDLAMRTAAGPEVFHYPAADEDASYELDQQFIDDAVEYLTAAAKMDDWKSRLFYGRCKYARPELGDEPGDPRCPALPDYEDFLEGEMSLAHIANPQLIHAILGVATEGAEMVEDLLKLTRGQTHDSLPTLANVVREGGDVHWFLELLAVATGFPTAAMRDGNIKRLAQRYPDKFSEDDAAARADEAA